MSIYRHFRQAYRPAPPPKTAGHRGEMSDDNKMGIILLLVAVLASAAYAALYLSGLVGGMEP